MATIQSVDLPMEPSLIIDAKVHPPGGKGAQNSALYWVMKLRGEHHHSSLDQSDKSAGPLFDAFAIKPSGQSTSLPSPRSATVSSAIEDVDKLEKIQQATDDETPRGAAPCDNADAHHATILGPCSDDSEDIVKEDVSENSIPIPGPSQHRAKAVDVNQEWAAYSARLHYERDRSRSRWVHPEWEERSLLRQKLLLKTRKLNGGKVDPSSVLDEFTDPPFPDQAKSRRMFPALFARHAFTEEEASEYALAVGKARLVTYHSKWGEYDIRFVSQLIDIAIHNNVVPSEQRVQHLAKKFGEAHMKSSTTPSA